MFRTYPFGAVRARELVAPDVGPRLGQGLAARVLLRAAERGLGDTGAARARVVPWALHKSALCHICSTTRTHLVTALATVARVGHDVDTLAVAGDLAVAARGDADTRRAGLAIATARTTLAAVLVVELEVGADTVARNLSWAAGLPRSAGSRRAALALSALRTTRSAVVDVGLRVYALPVASDLSGLAARGVGAGSRLALLVRRALVTTNTAVVVVGGRSDADPVAGNLSRSAGERAATANTRLAVRALVTTRTAVGRIRLRVHAAPAT